MLRGGLGHDVDGVRVVEDAGLRRHLLKVGDEALQDVDGAQGHEEAARPLGLLADDPVGQREALVQAARLEAARSVAAQHGVHVGQARPSVSGRLEAQVQATGRRHPFGEAPHDIEVGGVQVDEHDLRAGETGPVVVDEGGHGAGRSRRAASQVGELDGCHRPTP